MKEKQTESLDGILVIDKPVGMTSHDVIARLRRKYKQKKFGHTGTLDPDASGVLVILAGKAAKCLQFFPDTDKEYIARLALGTETDTDDATGQVTCEKPVNRDFSLAAVLKEFEGRQHQLVPATSAKKIAGKKLLEYQRQGKEVPPVYADVTIYETEVLDEESLTFRVACSSGTYIRALCRDVARATGNCGHMQSLRRTRAGGFTLEQAESLDQEMHRIHPVETALDALPQIGADQVSLQDVRNGRHLHLDLEEDRVLILDENGHALAVYDRDHGDVFACARGLW
ncbi:tRNA pseudouridine(55) synthase TruB [uncultured Faecalibaculum sp.]|uniref:tRNA pseudouridine(55) synthase TruB n=1 Tax=uncultured Faecalibaculum sp. TaxID=1729681 RepID=UPI00260630B5|nr:tRNA pseudouridine(55) synthase TruB [uncultured Faecalibaculum sp.]